MLWFDVSDIVRIKSSAPTGTQRTSTNVLHYLFSQRSDVKLFKFDRKQKCLLEVFPRDLPRGLAGLTDRDSIKAKEGGSDFAGLPATNSFISRAKRLARRLASAKSASGQSGRGLDEPPKASKQEPTPLAFRPGDVLLSMSTNRDVEGYADAIASRRAQDRVKCVNLIHDLIPILFPQWVSERSAKRFTKWARQQIQNADLILTISEFQKAEIENYIIREGLSRTPIEVVYNGDDHISRSDVEDRRNTHARPPQAPKRPFALCVSSFDVRKNHACLYQVWRQLARDLGAECPQLILIGKQVNLGEDLIDQMTNDPLVKGLILLRPDGVPDEELVWYYDNCLFTLFPTHYEGWGLPVAESLGRGKLCIASDTSSVPEIGRDLVDYFEPTNIDECYGLAIHAITDAAYRRRREQEIREKYVPRKWADAASRIGSLVDRLSTQP